MSTKWHADLDWDSLKQWYRHVRKRYFGADRREGTYLVVSTDNSLNEVRAALGQLSYAPNWEQSYFKGEQLNLAQVVWDPAVLRGDVFEWFQTHVRGYLHDDGIWLTAHWELEPTEAPREHIKGWGFDLDRGMETLESALDEQSVPYERQEWSA